MVQQIIFLFVFDFSFFVFVMFDDEIFFLYYFYVFLYSSSFSFEKEYTRYSKVPSEIREAFNFLKKTRKCDEYDRRDGEMAQLCVRF